MNDPFEVLSSERGVVRVFTTDLEAEGSAAVTSENVHRLLGDDLTLDASRIEVFPSSALDAMGLSLYLQEGYGIPEGELAGTAAALDSLKGLVILVASGAFQGQPATLNPKAGLRFVGAFREPGMEPPQMMSAPDVTPEPIQTGGSLEPLETRSIKSWPLVLVGLLAAAALVLFFAF